MNSDLSLMRRFTDQPRYLMIERHEVDMPEFRAVRRSLGQIFFRMKEVGEPESDEIADGLRYLLSQWLTSPIMFDESIAQLIKETTGPYQMFKTRWGQDLGNQLGSALSAAQSLAGQENPIRTKLAERLSKAKIERKSVCIYSHRSGDALFRELGEELAYVHSPAEYRTLGHVDVMLKVGPLRSRGWGAVPHALITAPRFDVLAQFVWAGCNDEDGYGFDPVMGLASVASKGIRVNYVGDQRQTTQSGSSGSSEKDSTLEFEDEFSVFATAMLARETRRATLIQITNDEGILYPPHASALCFDPREGQGIRIKRQSIEDVLPQEMYLVRYSLFDDNETEIHAGYGEFSSLWKEALRRELRGDQDAFGTRLRKAGLHLDALLASSKYWAKAPTTVIHAPQKRGHFELLIRELHLQLLGEPVPTNWWKLAWREVVASRAVAIQAGVHDHEVHESEVLNAMLELEDTVDSEFAAGHRNFTLPLSWGGRVQGLAYFDLIHALERGFMAPEKEVRIIQDIGSFEKWRA